MKNTKQHLTVEKSNGRFYTPNYIVKNILDMSGYYDENILCKNVIDNSCGDGAFLTEIVNRYCEISSKKKISKDLIKQELETYIHGIELDANEHKKCIENINKITACYGIENVKWDIRCGDTLLIHDFDNKMDFVLGNPPYIRVHNLGGIFDSIKKYSFAQSGMTDLYIVFYEIGLKMLNPNGILGYITPSSFFNSVAGSYMRKYFVENNLIQKIVDLKHFQAFSAMTYTTIVILNKQNKKSSIDYYNFDEKNLIPYYVDTLTKDDYYISNNFYFSQKENLEMLKKVFLNLGHCDIEVKNGYATLCDNVFINKFNFQSKYILPIIKASKGIKKTMIYPYDKFANLISEEELKTETELYEYLLSNKEILLKRSSEKGTNWYSFGRSQALKDTYKDKIAINNLIRTKNDLKLISAPSGTGVYSGLYLIGKNLSIDLAKEILVTEEFAIYISLLGKYKSGGFYTFSSKDVKLYLDYKLAYNGGLFE